MSETKGKLVATTYRHLCLAIDCDIKIDICGSI